jgi:hypothetical protein
MRDQIVNKYADEDVEKLSSDVLTSAVIPAELNRIRGDIFELWLERKGHMQRQSPVFKDRRLYRKRIADGIRGTALVDAKVRRPGARPDQEAQEQMEDYATIISRGLTAINRGDAVQKGPFTRVIYMFSDDDLIALWRPTMAQKITASGGVFEIRRA